jgi:hypothetical protein
MQSILKFCARGGFSMTKLLAAIAILTLAQATTSKAAIFNAYDARIGPPFTGTNDTHYAQQITLAGAPGPTAIYGYTLDLDWSNYLAGNQTLTLDLYAGANLSSITPNALASATLLDSSSVVVAPQGSNGTFAYSLSYGSTPIYIPSSTFTLAITLDNASDTALSTAVGGSFTNGTPALGSNPAFIWNDSNSDGIFSGTEQSFPAGSQSNIDVAVQVPEPATISVLVGIGGLGLLRRRRIA